jgi:hypothetical protein
MMDCINHVAKSAPGGYDVTAATGTEAYVPAYTLIRWEAA